MVIMMSNSNWNPFFALANTRHKIDEAIDDRNNVEKPNLSEDSLYELQDRIVESYESCSVVKIKYFKNNRYVDETGVVSKVDAYSKTVTINNLILSFDNILEVELQ